MRRGLHERAEEAVKKLIWKKGGIQFRGLN